MSRVWLLDRLVSSRRKLTSPEVGIELVLAGGRICFWICS